MKLKELKQRLLSFDDNMEVVLGTNVTIMPVQLRSLTDWECNGQNYLILMEREPRPDDDNNRKALAEHVTKIFEILEKQND